MLENVNFQVLETKPELNTWKLLERIYVGLEVKNIVIIPAATTEDDNEDDEDAESARCHPYDDG